MALSIASDSWSTMRSSSSRTSYRHLEEGLTPVEAALKGAGEIGYAIASRATTTQHVLQLAPDPSTHSRCTLGGMIGNNACGSHSAGLGPHRGQHRGTRSGHLPRHRGPPRRDDPGRDRRGRRRGRRPRPARSPPCTDLAQRNLAALRTKLGRFPRQVSGYALEHLLPERRFHLARALVGSEGTLAVVLSATVRLVAPPPARALVVLGFSDACAAADAVPALLRAPAAGAGRARPRADRHRHPARDPRGHRHPARRAGLAVRRTRRSRRTNCPARPRRWSRPRTGAAGLHRQRGHHRSRTGPARCGGSARTGRAWRPACPTAPRPGPDGRTRPYRPTDSAPICGSSPRLLDRHGLQRRRLRALRRGLSARPHRLRLHHRARHRRLPRLRHRGRPAGRRARRLAVRRARRRAGPLRAAAADVRARRSSPCSRSSRRIWDPDNGLNPGMIVRPLPVDGNLRRQPAPHPAAPGHRLPLPRRRRRLRQGHPPLRRRRQVPLPPPPAAT